MPHCKISYLLKLRYVLKFDNLHMTQCAKIIVIDSLIIIRRSQTFFFNFFSHVLLRFKRCFFLVFIRTFMTSCSAAEKLISRAAYLVGPTQPAYTSPLHVAAQQGHVDVARILIKASSNMKFYVFVQLYAGASIPMGQGGHVPPIF